MPAPSRARLRLTLGLLIVALLCVVFPRFLRGVELMGVELRYGFRVLLVIALLLGFAFWLMPKRK